MKYDFNIPAKNLNGKEEPGRTLTDVLAEFVGTEGKGNMPKLCYWYAELMAKKPLELDEPDHSMLYNLIEDSERMVVFIKVQLFEVLKK